MVSFVGDKGFMYKANLCLRTALKVLKPIHTATVKDDQALISIVLRFSMGRFSKR